MPNKRNYPSSLQSFAQKGDRLLYQLVRRYTRDLELTPSVMSALRQFLTSNKFLATMNPGFNVRIKGESVRYANINKYGDMVEAKLHWLRINYGFEAAERYFLNGVKNYYQSNY